MIVTSLARAQRRPGSRSRQRVFRPYRMYPYPYQTRQNGKQQDGLSLTTTRGREGCQPYKYVGSFFITNHFGIDR